MRAGWEAHCPQTEGAAPSHLKAPGHFKALSHIS